MNPNITTDLGMKRSLLNIERENENELEPCTFLQPADGYKGIESYSYQRFVA